MKEKEGVGSVCPQMGVRSQQDFNIDYLFSQADGPRQSELFPVHKGPFLLQIKKWWTWNLGNFYGQ